MALTAVGAAAAIAYAPSFAVPFQFDDYARLGENWDLAHGSLVEALRWLGTSRVVPALSIVLNHRLGGFDPVGFHVLNFAVHLLASAGVFALALALCRTPRLRERWTAERAFWLATAAATLFACHPLQTQAVTYIIQRYASIAALFYIWAIVCYLRARTRQVGGEPGRPRPYFIAAAALALCAVLSKENAASLPAALLLVEWTGFGWPRARLIALGVGCALAMLLVVVVWKAAVWKPTETSAPTLIEELLGTDGPLAQRPIIGGENPPLAYLLTQAVVLPRYLALVVLPWGQNLDPDIPLARSLSPPVLGGTAFLLAFAALGVSQMRRRPLLGFAILWFFITLSVESSIIGLNDVMAEHRMYLPMAGLAVGFGALFVAVLDRAPRLAVAAGAIVTVVLVALTFARNVVWLSPITLWVDAAEKSPSKARPLTNAGVGYHEALELDAAVDHYCRALALDPDDEVARDNLSVALEMRGQIDEEISAKVVGVRPDGSMMVEIDDVAAYCPEREKRDHR